MIYLKILISFFIALIIQFQPWPILVSVIMAQWTGLVFIYWTLECPYQINLLLCWLLGLIIDVLSGTLLGVHSLALVMLVYLTRVFAYRINMFSLFQQVVIVLLLCFLYLFFQWGLLTIFDQPTPLGVYWFSPLASAMWWILLARFRRHKHQINYYRFG